VRLNTIIFINNFSSLIKWALVGTLTNILDVLIFITLISFTPSVIASNLCAGFFSISFNYIAHYSWSFKSNFNHSKSGSRYLLNLVVFWVLNTLVLKYLISLGINPKVAKLIPIPIFAPLSFLSLRLFVFKKYLL
jgi:putative flippase GtrA